MGSFAGPVERASTSATLQVSVFNGSNLPGPNLLRLHACSPTLGGAELAGHPRKIRKAAGKQFGQCLIADVPPIAGGTGSNTLFGATIRRNTGVVQARCRAKFFSGGPGTSSWTTAAPSRTTGRGAGGASPSLKLSGEGGLRAALFVPPSVDGRGRASQRDRCDPAVTEAGAPRAPRPAGSPTRTPPPAGRRNSGAPAARRRNLVLMPTKRDPRLVSLGYGRYVRADRVVALVPLGPDERGEGRRTYVHVDGLGEPLVASRSERAILADVEAALTEAAGIPRRRAPKGQEALL